eukprot:750609-Hanusia_phi.AAC.10
MNIHLKREEAFQHWLDFPAPPVKPSSPPLLLPFLFFSPLLLSSSPSCSSLLSPSLPPLLPSSPPPSPLPLRILLPPWPPCLFSSPSPTSLDQTKAPRGPCERAAGSPKQPLGRRGGRGKFQARRRENERRGEWRKEDQSFHLLHVQTSTFLVTEDVDDAEDPQSLNKGQGGDGMMQGVEGQRRGRRRVEEEGEDEPHDRLGLHCEDA